MEMTAASIEVSQRDTCSTVAVQHKASRTVTVLLSHYLAYPRILFSPRSFFFIDRQRRRTPCPRLAHHLAACSRSVCTDSHPFTRDNKIPVRSDDSRKMEADDGHPNHAIRYTVLFLPSSVNDAPPRCSSSLSFSSFLVTAGATCSLRPPSHAQKSLESTYALLRGRFIGSGC